MEEGGSIKDILFENSQEYYKNGLKAHKDGEYNSSVTLFFKALSSLVDLFVFVEGGSSPTNHSERFRICKEKYPEIYEMIDKDFVFYRDSYHARLNKEVSEILLEDVRKLFEKVKGKI